MTINLSDVPRRADSPGLIFIPEIIDLQGLQEPIGIGSCAHLRRIPSEERGYLRLLLDPFIKLRGMSGINPWEFEEYPHQNGGTGFKFIDNPEDHQFWSVTYWRKYYDIELELALALAEPGLTPLVVLSDPLNGIGGRLNAHAVLNWMSDNHLSKRHTILPHHVSSINRTYDLLISFYKNQNKDFDFIRKAISDFENLKSVSRRLPIFVVGLFSIIESLLTTDQQNTTDKSLNHQLQAKLIMLNNRFHDPLDLVNYFGSKNNIQFKTAIKFLYTYRSTVAHGSLVDFDKTLSSLVSHESVCNFLHTCLRRIILLAIEEPQFISDLKNC